MGLVVEQVQLFLLALQRFGCIHVPHGVASDAGALRRAIRYWPLVGLLIGVLCGLIFLIAVRWFPPAVAVLIAIGAGLFLTRAGHERELYRTAELLLPGLGVVLPNFLLLVQFAALAYQQESALLLAFLCGHSFSRFAALPLIVRFDRRERLGIANDTSLISWGEFLCAAFYGLLPLIAGISTRTELHATLLIGAGAALAVAAWLGWILYRRFGRITIENLGAVQQCAAAAFYLGLLISPR